jgi:oligoendopeptidase F
MRDSYDQPLPHWDMSTIFPSLDSPEFAASFSALKEDIAQITDMFDRFGIMLRADPLPIDAHTMEIFETTLAQLNTVSTAAHLHYTYISSFISTNSRNTSAQTWMSTLQLEMTAFEKLMTRFTAWIGSLEDVEALIAQSPVAQTHAYATREARIESEHLMSPEEESLATELNLIGGRAWAKFYNNFSSQITADITLTEETQRMPMTAIRNLAFKASREVRRHAYDVELAAWEANAMPIAAALNGIKGQMNTLSRHRGWASPVDVALFNNHIDRETLDTMLSTAREFFPVFRRYLRAKASVLGIDKLSWYDLFAPVSKSEHVWSFETSRAFIVKEFHTFSPRLGSLAERAFDEYWIDAEPRDGKRGGAFCMWMRDGESRILANFKPAYGGMGTLAHELGHAYHNLARAGQLH